MKIDLKEGGTEGMEWMRRVGTDGVLL